MENGRLVEIKYSDFLFVFRRFRSAKILNPNASISRRPKQTVLSIRQLRMASSCGESSSGSESPVPSVIERLGNLRPSKELLEYYRRKLAEYDKDHEVLIGKLDQFKFSFEEQVGGFTVKSIKFL